MVGSSKHCSSVCFGTTLRQCLHRNHRQSRWSILDHWTESVCLGTPLSALMFPIAGCLWLLSRDGDREGREWVGPCPNFVRSGWRQPSTPHWISLGRNLRPQYSIRNRYQKSRNFNLVSYGVSELSHDPGCSPIPNTWSSEYFLRLSAFVPHFWRISCPYPPHTGTHHQPDERGV